MCSGLKFGLKFLSSLISPLQEFMKIVYTKAGRRTKKSVAQIQIKISGWGEEKAQSFEDCKHKIVHQTMLAHRDASRRTFIYTDACEDTWSRVAIKVQHKDIIRTH